MKTNRLICIALVTIMALTVVSSWGVVSAKKDVNTNIRQFNIVWIETGDVIGKLVVNVETGQYVINANYGKFSHDEKEDSYKEPAQEIYPERFSALLVDDVSNVWVWDIGTLMSGGNLHGQGVITDKEVSNLPPGYDGILTWLKDHGSDAVFWPGFITE